MKPWWHGWRLPKRGMWRLEQSPSLLAEPPQWACWVSACLAVLAMWYWKLGALWPILPIIGITTLPGPPTSGMVGPGWTGGLQLPAVMAYNVRAGPFGAKADGIADDTIPIQAAINAAQNAGGGHVFLPIGTYLVTSSIIANRLVLISGAGWGSVITSTSAITILEMNEINSTTDSEVRGTIWANFQVDGGAPANNGEGIRIIKWNPVGAASTARASVLSMIRVVNCALGLRCVNTQGIAVRDCKFENNTTGAKIADNSQLGTFDCCDFRGNVTGLIMESSGAIIIAPIDKIYCWTIKDCHFEGNSGKGCVMDGALYNTFINSKWEANGDTFLTLQNTVSGFRCDGNVFIGGLWNGNVSVPTVLQLDIQSASGTSFFGCAFNVGSTNGINLQSGAFRTYFGPGCSLGSTITDNVGANVGTSYQTTLSSRVALESVPFTLTDAATIAIDSSLADRFIVTLNVAGATRAMGTPTKTRSGQRITITVIQDGTGGRAVTWPAVFKNSWSDTGNTANKRSTISHWFDGTNWNQDGAQTPYV